MRLAAAEAALKEATTAKADVREQLAGALAALASAKTAASLDSERAKVAAAAAEHDLQLTRGSSFQLETRLKDSDALLAERQQALHRCQQQAAEVEAARAALEKQIKDLKQVSAEAPSSGLAVPF